MIRKKLALDAVDLEEEFPGDMPDSVYMSIKIGSKEYIEALLRSIVIQTKSHIRSRIVAIADTGGAK